MDTTQPREQLAHGSTIARSYAAALDSAQTSRGEEMRGWKDRERGILERFGRSIALLCLLASDCTASAQSKRPNLSGTWVMNSAKSRLQIPLPDSTIFFIRDEEPIVRILRTHARAGKVDTLTITLRTDSTEFEWSIRGATVTSRAWWEGSELVFWSSLAQAGRPVSQVVRYSLSPDGKTFTALERVDAAELSHLNQWVFDRRR